MTTPIDELKKEHRVIERVLTVLESLSRRLETNDPVDPETLARAREVIVGFGDRCHHAKEEHALFPALASKRSIIEWGPVRILTSEHEAGRKLMSDLARAIEQMASNEAYGRAGAHRAIDTYTRMLRRHIAKEEDILFPLAETLLSDEEAVALQRQFDAVERDLGSAHERFEADVNALEAALA